MGQVQNVWGEVTITYMPTEHAAIEALLHHLRLTHVNGGAYFARFHLSHHPILHWFWLRNRLQEIQFFERFVTQPAVISAFPELRISKPLNRKVELQPGSPYTLDGEITATLLQGGAYKRFEGRPREAKQLAMEFCDALIEDRYNEVQIFKSYSPWSEWFYDIAWDYTWFGIDKQCTEVWMLCVTDTD